MTGSMRLAIGTILLCAVLAGISCDRQRAATEESAVSSDTVSPDTVSPDTAAAAAPLPTLAEATAATDHEPTSQHETNSDGAAGKTDAEIAAESDQIVTTPAIVPAESASDHDERSTDTSATTTLDDKPEQGWTPEGRSPGEFRLLLPTTAGPLLVDLDIQIAEQALSNAFEERIDSILRDAANSNDVTWNDWLDQIRSHPGRFGGSPVEPQQYRNIARMYDKNRNGRPDPDEAAKFLFRDSGSSGPFRLDGTDAFRQINRSQSPFFLAMDRNGNHVIEADEAQIANESLSRFDRNGDQRIDATEVIRPLRETNQINDAWNNRRTSRWGDVAMDLGGFIDWGMVSYTIAELSPLAVFHDGGGAIAAIDQNDDETIDEDEARQLLEVPADLRLRLHFDSNVSTNPTIEVQLAQKDEMVTIASYAKGDRVRIASDRLQLIAMARDLPAGGEAIPPQAFTVLDADKDEELDETEIPAGALREYSFEELDADASGKLSYQELLEGMRSESTIWSVQVRARGAEAPDAIFAWLDEDQNLSLSTRELLACRDRLKQIAADDGTIRATDFPDTFVVQFGRGNPQQNDSLFTFAPQGAARDADRPMWAESMDANQDGDISPEEFLGDAEQFKQLDRDEDGFLSSSETGDVHPERADP